MIIFIAIKSIEIIISIHKFFSKGHSLNNVIIFCLFQNKFIIKKRTYNKIIVCLILGLI
jgi:hypothetical protein